LTSVNAKKEPCWVIMGCSRLVYPDCPAFQNPQKPCWEHDSTKCEELIGIGKECKDCKFFKLCQSD